MSLLEQFNLVYGSDARILDPSVEPNAVTGVGSQLHIEPFHTVRWIAGEMKASRNVVADGQSIVFRGHETKTMIPHIPIPVAPVGPALAKTIIVDSKCQICCHNPDLEVEGQSVGIALVILAPPLHCASLCSPAQASKASSVFSGVKKAMQGMHKVNRSVAKIQQLNQRVHRALDRIAMLQIAGSGLMGAYDAASNILGLENKKSGPQARDPFATVKDMLKAQSDYREAQRLLDACPEPLQTEYFDDHLRYTQLQQTIDAQELEHRRLQDEASKVRASSSPQARRTRIAPLRCRLKIQRNRRNLEQIHKRQRMRLAKATPDPLTKQVGCMLPSLTSFSATSANHTVKVGMSPSSYARMSLGVLAVAMSDIVDHALGLLGDSLLNAGPKAPVSGWVAELAGGVLQGMIGSPLRSWGARDTLDFKVPVHTGRLGGTGLARGVAEFHWRMDPQQDGRWVPVQGLRAGVDLPGRDLDQVQVLRSASAGGVDLPLPEVW